VAYSPNAPELGWRDFLFMARRKLLNLGGRFFPYLPVRLQCLRMAGVLLGRNVYIGEDLIISEILEDRHPHIIIGDRVAIAQRVTIVTASNPNYSHLAKFFEGIQGKGRRLGRGRGNYTTECYHRSRCNRSGWR
jgi:acetyltransferase-like isoleucine patch superfamily enzyme